MFSPRHGYFPLLLLLKDLLSSNYLPLYLRSPPQYINQLKNIHMMFVNVASYSHRTVTLVQVELGQITVQIARYLLIDMTCATSFSLGYMKTYYQKSHLMSSHDSSNNNILKLSIFYQIIQLALHTIPIMGQHIANQVKHKPIYASFI